MIKIDKAIIVEGKYDKIKLENFIDGYIIPTNGFRIFKDKEKMSLIRLLAQKNGIIILTDSDSAGNLIRSHLKGFIPADAITNVYIPQIRGKERRKSKPGKENLLGVEGVSEQVLLEAFSKAGIVGSRAETKGRAVNKSDFMLWGLSGTPQAANKRKNLLLFLNLPEYLSANALLDFINAVYGYDNFSEVLCQWQREQTKN